MRGQQNSLHICLHHGLFTLSSVTKRKRNPCHAIDILGRNVSLVSTARRKAEVPE